jgi:hypothetical protein
MNNLFNRNKYARGFFGPSDEEVSQFFHQYLDEKDHYYRNMNSQYIPPDSKSRESLHADFMDKWRKNTLTPSITRRIHNMPIKKDPYTIPDEKLNEELMEKGNAQCPICLDYIESCDNYLECDATTPDGTQLPHKFHKKCPQYQYMNQPDITECPICRGEILKKPKNEMCSIMGGRKRKS